MDDGDDVLVDYDDDNDVDMVTDGGDDVLVDDDDDNDVDTEETESW